MGTKKEKQQQQQKKKKKKKKKKKEQISLDSPLWIITLQTPALLADPHKLRQENGKNASWKRPLHRLEEAYGDYWKEVGEFELVRYFSNEVLHGGYLVRRYQQGKPYEPFLLTDAGSLFVLTHADGEIGRQKIEEWMRRGLPLPEWARKRYGETWRTCPYLPSDGFGEIAVNLCSHAERYPTVSCEIPWEG